VDRRRESLPTRVDELPSLPPAFDRALAKAAAALGIQLDERAMTALADHARLLMAWNAAINLTAIVDPERIAVLHVADSLAAVPIIAAAHGPAGRPDRGPVPEPRRGPGRAPRRILDLGSGAGYPGLPIAIALPGIEVLLVESVAKKARFLETACAAMGLGVRVRVANARAEALANARAEALANARPGSGPGRRPEVFDVVTARAVGALPELVELALPLLAVGGRLVAWKRGEIGVELEAAARASARLGGGELQDHPVAVPGLEGHRLIVIEKSSSTPPGFPRDPAARRAHPW
jgi:16S rRNA (guanine527-N7)-methyltransferase